MAPILLEYSPKREISYREICRFQAPRSVENSGGLKKWGEGGWAETVKEEALLVVYYLIFDIFCPPPPQPPCSAVPGFLFNFQLECGSIVQQDFNQESKKQQTNNYAP